MRGSPVPETRWNTDLASALKNSCLGDVQWGEREAGVCRLLALQRELSLCRVFQSAKPFLEAHFASLFRMHPICVARQKRLEKDRLRHLTLRIMPF
jgi:hypothetical protein